MRSLLLNTAACFGLALALNSCTSTLASDPAKTIIAGEQAQKKIKRRAICDGSAVSATIGRIQGFVPAGVSFCAAAH